MSSFQPLIIAASGAFLFLICLNNHVFNYAPKLDLWLECTEQKRKKICIRERKVSKMFFNNLFGINNRDFIDYYHRNTSDSKLAVHLHLMNHLHACSDSPLLLFQMIN